MSEVLIASQISPVARAAVTIPAAHLFTWGVTEGYVSLSSEDTVPTGIAISEIAEGDLVSPHGEWFQRGVVVSVPLSFEHTAGEYLLGGADGAITNVGDGAVFAICLQDGEADQEAQIFCL